MHMPLSFICDDGVGTETHTGVAHRVKPQPSDTLAVGLVAGGFLLLLVRFADPVSAR